MSGHHPRETAREFLTWLRQSYHVDITSAERGAHATTPSNDRLVEQFAAALELAPEDDDTSPELAAAHAKIDKLVKQVSEVKQERRTAVDRQLTLQGENSALHWAFESLADRS